jgi:hypothetical protein
LVVQGARAFHDPPSDFDNVIKKKIPTLRAKEQRAVCKYLLFRKLGLGAGSRRRGKTTKCWNRYRWWSLSEKLLFASFEWKFNTRYRREYRTSGEI